MMNRSPWPGFIRALTLACAVHVGWVAPSTAQVPSASASPGPEITLRVRQVAGRNVYLEVGTLHGLVRGDTVEVLRGDVPMGSLVVTAATEGRSVLSFAGPALAVSGGDVLTLRLMREPTEPLPPDAIPGDRSPGPVPEGLPLAGARSSAPAREVRPSANQALEVPGRRGHGRVALDLSAVHSTTRFGGTDPQSVARTFTTPSLTVDATVPDAIAGFRFRTSLRATYRYSDRDIVTPAQAVRVHTASLERAFTSVPLRLALGRFHSPAESYSGYWDGLMMRLGGEGLGAGALVGFQPDRWNERPSTDLPKASVFVDAQGEGPGWQWRGDLSAHTARPASGAPDHTFVGLSQRMSAGPLRLSQDLQIDRDPAAGDWRVSDFRLRGVLKVTPKVDLRLGAARRESYLFWRDEDVFASRSDRVTAGLGFRAGAAYLGLDLAGNRRAGDAFDSWTWTGTFMTPRLPGLPGIAAAGSVSRWDGPLGDVWSAAPSLLFSVGAVRVRAGYRLRRTTFLEREDLTHGLDLSVDASLDEGLRASVRLGGQRGTTLRSETVRITLYRIF